MNQELTNLDVFVDAWNKFCESVDRAKTHHPADATLFKAFTTKLTKLNTTLVATMDDDNDDDESESKERYVYQLMQKALANKSEY